jgi:hypothetical protein
VLVIIPTEDFVGVPVTLTGVDLLDKLERVEEIE